MTQSELIFKSLFLIKKTGIRSDMTPSDWLKTLLYLHSKGWLYVLIDGGRVVAVIAAYRVPEINDKVLTDLPLNEEGKILFVSFAVAEKGYKTYAMRKVKGHIKNIQDFDEIAYERLNGDIIRRGRNGERIKQSKFTADSDVSGGAAVSAGIHEFSGLC